MVGAPDVVVMFDKLDKLDQMCQDLTADQCSLALECEVNDPGGGSPTTCARSYDYWLAAAARVRRGHRRPGCVGELERVRGDVRHDGGFGD